ncbi:MAG: ribonuclease HI family protein [Candidatus Shapirobacteria bacterium]
MKVKIFTDGGSRGNPGISGFGVIVIDENKKIIFEASKYLGIRTNNEAEYEGLIFGLNWLKENELAIDEAEFNADSELMIKQMQGLYKVKADNLKNLNKQAREFVLEIKSKIKFNAIRRELNSAADSLANDAMDKKL